jgi:hypothetical protein
MSEPSADALQAQLAAWRHNRGLYPGWVVAPRAVRSRIWDHTNDWLRSFVVVAGGLPPRERLAALYELNWCLELCLSPVWNDLVPVYESALRAIRPFPELAEDFPDPSLAFGTDTAGIWDWAAVRREWLALAFAILRYYREERRRGEFDIWAGRLGRAGDSTPDDRARLCHEHCLRALGDMDDEAARAALNDWPRASPDAMWAVRRAALLGELGEVTEARSVVEATLASLRGVTSRASAAGITRLSREGWAAQLLAWAEMEMSLGRPRPRPEEPSAALAHFGCDPEEERAFFRHRLDRPPPDPDPQVTVSPGFEPGRYTRTVHSGGDLFQTLFVAYQYLRFVEEAADPPRFGALGLTAGRLAQVARWFILHDPVRTRTLMCRLRDAKLIDECLPRHRVAALSADAVTDLFAVGIGAIERALPQTAGYTFVESDLRAARAHKTLEAAITLLARISIRRPREDLDRLWGRALTLYVHPTVRESLVLHGPLEQLFHSLVTASPPDLLASRFDAVLTLPIPGSPDQPAHHPELWHEDRVVDRLVRRVGNRQWNAARPRRAAFVEHLLGLAAGEPSPTRHKAFGRLLLLHRRGYLTRAEMRRLARLYWTPMPAAREVPEFGGFLRWLCLVLPEPRGVRSIDRFRKAVLDGPLPPTQPGGGNEGRLYDWLYATNLSRSGRETPGRRYVDWTPGEAERMAAAIIEWWDREGRAMASRSTSALWAPFLETGLEARLEACLEVLRFVIIPRLPVRSPQVPRMMGFVEEAAGLGYGVGVVLPSLSLLDPGFDAAGRLRRALMSPDRRVRVSALRGLLHWFGQPAPIVRRDRRRAAPPAPASLLMDLGAMCAGLQQPGLAETLDTVSGVFEVRGRGVGTRFIQSVVIGLEYLAGEAVYREVEVPNAHIPDHEVPMCRSRIAQVVCRLTGLGRRDATIVRWHEELSADPLPEVRRALAESDDDD